MVNSRLMWILESKGLLASEQCGFRPNRSTVNHLVHFDSYIRKTFAPPKNNNNKKTTTTTTTQNNNNNKTTTTKTTKNNIKQTTATTKNNKITNKQTKTTHHVETWYAIWSLRPWFLRPSADHYRWVSIPPTVPRESWVHSVWYVWDWDGCSPG